MFELTKADGSVEFVTGSTPYQVAVAMSRECGKFVDVSVYDTNTGIDTEISGFMLFSLAYLDNNCTVESDALNGSEEWMI